MGQRGRRPDGVIGVAAVLVLLSLAAVAGAQEKTPPENALTAPAPPAEPLVLPPLLVTAPPPVASSSEQLIPGKDFEVRPQGRPVDVLKGPYFPEYGDFDTAGVVNFRTRDFVPENTLSIAGGSFNTQRYLALLSPTRDALKTFVAVEGFHNDGPFEHPSRYDRLNIFAKASATLAEDMKLSLWASFYESNWRGPGQIPER